MDSFTHMISKFHTEVSSYIFPPTPQVSEQLDAKLGQYLQEVGSVSRSMKQQHASRHTHL